MNYQQPTAVPAFGNQAYDDDQEYDQIDNQDYPHQGYSQGYQAAQGYQPAQGYQAQGYDQGYGHNQGYDHDQGYGHGYNDQAYQEEEEEPLYSNVESSAMKWVLGYNKQTRVWFI